MPVSILRRCEAANGCLNLYISGVRLFVKNTRHVLYITTAINEYTILLSFIRRYTTCVLCCMRTTKSATLTLNWAVVQPTYIHSISYVIYLYLQRFCYAWQISYRRSILLDWVIRQFNSSKTYRRYRRHFAIG